MTDKKTKNKAGPGRPKGAPNKVTAAVKEAVLNAFETVGGEAYLVTLAKSEPRTFATLLAKCIPAETRTELVRKFEHMTTEDLLAERARMDAEIQEAIGEREVRH